MGVDRHPGGRLAAGARITVGSIGSVLLLLAAVTLAAALTGTAAALLPGVGQWDASPGQTWAMAGVTVLLAWTWCSHGAWFVSALEGAPIAVRTVPAATAHVVRRFVREAGMVGSQRRSMAVVGAGLLVGAAAFAQNAALSRWSLLAETAVGPDARVGAIVEAPAWVQAIYFALYAPLWEELAYRGPLLLVVAYLSRAVATGRRRRVLVAAALLVSATVFGSVHASFSLLNAVTAGVGGLLFGAAAVWARSIWPAVIGHTLMNLGAGLMFALT